MLMTLSSCQTTDQARLDKAAKTIGQLQAGVHLPELPVDCRVKEPHVIVRVGSELRDIIVRERGQLNRQNARTDRCAANYDNVRTKYAAKGQVK